MSAFEFTTVLFGFVVALGLARVLGGVADLIRCWSRVEHPILYSLWFSLLVLFPIGWWTSLWQFSAAKTITLFQVIMMFHVPIFMYVAARLIVPSESEFEHIDSRYESVRSPFALCMALPALIGPIPSILFGNFELIYVAINGVLQGSLLIFRNKRYDYFVVCSCLVVYIAFIVQYRSMIGLVE